MRPALFIPAIIAALNAVPAYAGQNAAIGNAMDRAELYYDSPAYAYYEPRPVYYSTNYYAPNYITPPAPPPPIYVDGDTGSYCRAFSQTVRTNGQPHESYGTVCLQADGAWRVVE